MSNNEEMTSLLKDIWTSYDENKRIIQLPDTQIKNYFVLVVNQQKFQNFVTKVRTVRNQGHSQGIKKDDEIKPLPMNIYTDELKDSTGLLKELKYEHSQRFHSLTKSLAKFEIRLIHPREDIMAVRHRVEDYIHRASGLIDNTKMEEEEDEDEEEKILKERISEESFNKCVPPTITEINQRGDIEEGFNHEELLKQQKTLINKLLKRVIQIYNDPLR